jgi:F-box protein 9
MEENPDLIEFREQWKAELRSRNTATSQEQVGPQPPATSNIPSSSGESTSAAAVPSLPSKKTPVEVYRAAVHAEEDGRLDEALQLYRYAFKRDRNVDKAFHLEESALMIIKTDDKSAGEGQIEVAREVPTVAIQDPAIHSTTTVPLDELLAEFPDELTFISEDETSIPPVELLPPEILAYILLLLAHNHDVNAIERFAAASRKARAVSLDPVIWR